MRFSLDLFGLIACVFWFLVNVPAWTGKQSIALLSLDWGSVDLLTRNEGPVFPVTYLLSVGSIILAIYVLRRKQLSWKRSFLYGATFPFAPIGTFKLMYQNVGDVLRPQIFHATAFGEIVLISWTVLGLSTLTYWKASRLFFLGLLGILLLFAAWGLSGYLQYYEASVAGLAFNLLLKLDIFVLFWALLLNDRHDSIRSFGASTGVLDP